MKWLSYYSFRITDYSIYILFIAAEQKIQNLMA